MARKADRPTRTESRFVEKSDRIVDDYNRGYITWNEARDQLGEMGITGIDLLEAIGPEPKWEKARRKT